jgi:hypothetical protein
VLLQCLREAAAFGAAASDGNHDSFDALPAQRRLAAGDQIDDHK